MHPSGDGDHAGGQDHPALLFAFRATGGHERALASVNRRPEVPHSDAATHVGARVVQRVQPC